MKMKLTKMAQLVGLLTMTMASMSHPALAASTGGVLRIPFQGLTATPVALAALSAPSIAFGSQSVGTASAAQAVTLSNPGSASLSIAGTSSITAPFYLTGNSCGTSLSAGGSCTFQFEYMPSSAIPSSENVSVTTGAGVETVTLSGSGIAGIPSVSPGSVSFGGVTVDTTATAQTLTLYNTGNGPFSITSAPSAPAPFSLTSDTCSGTIAAGANCSMQVTFTPTTLASSSLPLTIPTSVGSVSVNLSGQGLGAVPAVSPASLSFGSVSVGATSSGQSVTFSNNGNEALSITSAPTVAVPFKITANTCSGTVAAGATCTVQVAYAPTSGTSSSSNLSIPTNWGNASVSLSGTGVALTPSASVSPTNALNMSFTDATITVRSTGSGSLTINSISLSYNDPDEADTHSSASIDSGGCSNGQVLPSDQSCAIVIDVTPNNAENGMNWTGTLTINTNAGTFSIPYSGFAED
jgi:hypothetical protein